MRLIRGLFILFLGMSSTASCFSRAGLPKQEIAFGAMERPLRQEFPAQNWMDYGAGDRGVALLNRGLPGNNVAGNVMLSSLMRSARLISYGGLEQSTSSDTGLELGKRIGFDYALVPHARTWQDAAVYRAGLDFNNPLLSRPATFTPASCRLGGGWWKLLVEVWFCRP